MELEEERKAQRAAKESAPKGHTVLPTVEQKVTSTARKLKAAVKRKASTIVGDGDDNNGQAPKRRRYNGSTGDGELDAQMRKKHSFDRRYAHVATEKNDAPKPKAKVKRRAGSFQSKNRYKRR